MFVNLCKSLVISILSLIVYMTLNDSKKEHLTENEKNKEYMIIISVISVTSFLVIQLSQPRSELIAVNQKINLGESFLNNKPPF